MKFVFSPFNYKTKYLYLLAMPILLITWFDQWSEFYWLPDKLRLQLFILAVILMTIAAIINVSISILYPNAPLNRQNNKNNLSDDH